MIKQVSWWEMTDWVYLAANVMINLFLFIFNSGSSLPDKCRGLSIRPTHCCLRQIRQPSPQIFLIHLFFFYIPGCLILLLFVLSSPEHKVFWNILFKDLSDITRRLVPIPNHTIDWLFPQSVMVIGRVSHVQTRSLTKHCVDVVVASNRYRSLLCLSEIIHSHLL